MRGNFPARFLGEWRPVTVAAYPTNIVEQDHRRRKRITRPMLGFNNFHSARATLVGIELMAMINKGQMKKTMSGSLSAAEQCYALAV
ncbi:hypothetical protein A9Q81_12900 [Gammaproteobacteria bacterium 42_54_T18]|nr:hypothetical protein A9Q81_12900 [Gammaproteobacteria bacterium 42_54_T18]